MIDFWNNIIAPVIPYILCGSIALFLLWFIPLGVDDNEHMSDW